MLPEPADKWFGAGLHWNPLHQLAFSVLTILEPTPDDPLHFAIGRAFMGAVPERHAEVLRVLSGVLAGEMMREGTLAGKLKTLAETHLAAEVERITREERVSAAAATRRVQAGAKYSEAVEGRRVAEYRVRAIAAYIATVREAQGQARTDQVDARRSDAAETWSAT